MKYSILLFILASVISVFAKADYYKILGVPKDADEKEIKKAYRNLSKIHHPDKNSGDDTAFIEIGEAYEVLMNSEKRAIYDRYGEEGLKNGGGAGGPGGGQHHDPFDMFANFFGGGQQQQRGRGGKPRGSDTQTVIEFTLKEFYNGVNSDFQLEMQDICSACSGSGSQDGQFHTCQNCKGQGRVLMKRQLGPGMFQQFESPCQHCKGTGKQIAHGCKKCKGEGVERTARKYNIHLEPGTSREHVEVYRGESDRSPEWIAGDLRVKVQESTTRGNFGYRRIGNNLYRTEVISLKESLNGDWERKLPFLDSYDNSIKIKRAPNEITLDGEVEVFRNKGMPIHNSVDEFGDLFIEYKVIYPGGNKQILSKLHDEL